MSRLARFTLATVAVTFLLVMVGGLVRATDSGLGCGDDWPRCYGHWVPPTSDFQAEVEVDTPTGATRTEVVTVDATETWIEYTHRALGTVVGMMTIGLLVGAVRRRKGDPKTYRFGVVLLPLVIAQGLLGAYVVNRELEAWTVVAHLGLAMAFFGTLLGLAVHLLVAEARDPVDRRLVRTVGLAGVSVYLLNLLGSYVTGRHAGLAFTDWPLMDGQLIPPHLDHTAPALHFAHRVAAVAVGLLLVYVVVEARRSGSRRIRRAGNVAGALFAFQILVGGVNVFTELHAASVTVHLTASVAIWGALVVTWALAWRTPTLSVERISIRPLLGRSRFGRARSDGSKARARRSGETGRSTIAAYVALTKPRIIELLLVTTVPTMVIAERGLPSAWLVVATVAGGALAAGGANAINMYVDRDIDRLMARTQSRPLVTGEVSPRGALAFAVALEVAAFAVLWGWVNLLSAVLALSATLFYVFVYTLWLKRSSPNNIVIGGAAGAVPVLVGWSAVTGSLGLAPLVLFAIIFYWTPPHFWALAIRYRDDYQAASVPMLPAVASLAATARKMLVYTVLLWALTVAFTPVAGMGDLYLAAAVLLGGVFTYHAVQLQRSLTPERAMRLFTWSITYITLLFGAMAIDQLVRT